MFPTYILELIKEAKHWLNYHQPQALLKVIARFLQE